VVANQSPRQAADNEINSDVATCDLIARATSACRGGQLGTHTHTHTHTL